MPGVDRRLGDDRVERLEIGRHHEDEPVNVFDPGCLYVALPVEVRHDLAEIVQWNLVVVIGPVPGRFLRDVRVSDPRFQVHDLGRRGSRIREARQVEHGFNVVDILVPDLGGRLVVLEVILAIRQAQPVLPRIDHVVIRVHEIGDLADVDRDRVTAAARFGEIHGEFVVVFDCGNTFELGPERLDAPGIARFHVQVGVVEVPDLLLGRTCSKIPARGLLDDCPDVGLCLVGENAEAAVHGLVGRNLGLGNPFAVDVTEEVVARPDARVHVLDGNAGFQCLGRVVRGRRCFLLAAGRQGHHRGGRH